MFPLDRNRGLYIFVGNTAAVGYFPTQYLINHMPMTVETLEASVRGSFVLSDWNPYHLLRTLLVT